jgi:beta-glucosidase/6-phospho-beta-glucosidase/beta-galactosidase
VDFETQERTLKQSARWYSRTARGNALAPDEDGIVLP